MILILVMNMQQIKFKTQKNELLKEEQKNLTDKELSLLKIQKKISKKQRIKLKHTKHEQKKKQQLKN